MEELKTVTVKEFVDTYKSLENAAKKKAYIKSMIKTNYVSYALKEFFAKKIVEATSYERDKDNNPTKNVKINSSQRYMMYVFTMVSNYTLVVMNKDNIIEDFDVLDSEGLVDEIIAAIPESEVKKFNTVLNMVYEDFMTNNYETHAYLSKQVDKVVVAGKDIVGKALPEVLKELDAEDIKALLNVFK